MIIKKKKFNTEKLEQLGELVRNPPPCLDRESNNLLEWALGELQFRKPLLVTEHYGDYCLCPRCDATIERDYTIYCVVCGQRFKWNMRKLKYVSWEERQARDEIKRPKKTFTVGLNAADDEQQPKPKERFIDPLYADCIKRHPPKTKIESEDERQKRYEEFFSENFND